MRERTRPPTHPGVLLKHQHLEPLHLSLTQAAAALGVTRKTLSKIVNARGAIIPDMALRLARAFHTTPELWLNLQRSYDLWQAQHRSEAWQHVERIVDQAAIGVAE
jgi:addiction module HigA family antidote